MLKSVNFLPDWEKFVILPVLKGVRYGWSMLNFELLKSVKNFGIYNKIGIFAVLN